MPCHAVDREPLKQNARVELGEKSIFHRLRVRVGRNYFAEKILGGALRLVVVCVRHRINNPALVFICGVGLATRHASSGASGVPRRVKVERRRQKQLSSPPWAGFWEIWTLS